MLTGVNDWNIVVMKCKSLAAKWEQLSIYLGLTFEVIDNIKGCGDNYSCRNEALKKWVKQKLQHREIWSTILEEPPICCS